MTNVPDVASLAELMKSLADETRLRLVALLSHGELCVCHLEGALGVPQPTVSRHLGILRYAGVVEARREGSWVYYKLAEQTDPAVARVLAAVVAGFEGQAVLAADVKRLRRTKGPNACR